MSITMTHLYPRDYLTSTWSGGTTTQLAIMPQGANYANRDFLWRVSSATVDLEESDFTVLPSYDRVIGTLYGDMRICHNGGAELLLRPYDLHRFSGGDATHSWGTCQDFNLMLRRNKCSGDVAALFLKRGEVQTWKPKSATSTLLVYCGEGTVRLEAEEQTMELKAGESVRIDGFCAELTFSGNAKLMIVQIFEDCSEGAHEE